VYSKNEHETPCADGDSEWVIMQMLYWDNYERRDGRRFLRGRLPCCGAPDPKIRVRSAANLDWEVNW
jgi:hypothetical protein